MSKQYLKVGQIVGNRGLSGELKVKSFCDSLYDFCKIERLYLSTDSSPLEIIYKKAFKNLILIKINGIHKVEDTVEFINKDVYASKKDIFLPKDRYFIDDIMGIDIIDVNNGRSYGKISDVIQTGANDVYCVKDTNGKEILIPAINEVIKNVDIAQNKIFVSPIRGLFDD